MQEGTETSSGHPQETRPKAELAWDVYAKSCPTRVLLDRIADKWTVLLLTTLKGGPMRFNALKRRVEGVSQKMLSQTLRQLERDGLVSRSVEATVPISVTYAITPWVRPWWRPCSRWSTGPRAGCRTWSRPRSHLTGAPR